MTTVSSKVIHSLTIFFFAYFICTVMTSEACQKQGETQDNCTSCNGGQVLVQSRCFKRLRGCLNYTLDDRNLHLKCSNCQYGYIAVDSICKREVLVRAQSSPQVAANNSPAPIRQYKPKKLSIGDIIKKHRKQNVLVVKNKQQKQVNVPKIIHQLDPKIFTPLVNQPQIHENKKSQNMIYEQLPQLKNIELIQISLFNKLSQSSDKIMEYVFMDGSKVLVEQSLQTSTIIGYSKNQQIKELHNFLKSKKQINSFKAQQSINYKFEIKSEPQNLIINCQNGHLSWILNQTQIKGSQNQKVNHIQFLESFEQYQIANLLQEKLSFYFRIAYKQFLKIVNIGNVPQDIERIEAKMLKSQDNSGPIIIFSVFYKLAGGEEKAVISFNTRNNATQIIEYLMDGVNLIRIQENISSLQSNEFPELKQENIRDFLSANYQTKTLLGNYYKILSIKPDKDKWSCQVVALIQSGVFKINLLVNKNKSLQLTNSAPIQQISKQSCADYKQNSQEIQLNHLLRKKYSILKNYPILSTKISMKGNKIQLLMIYSNNKFQQIIFVIENSSHSQKPIYKIKRSRQSYEGYWLQSQSAHGVLLQKLLKDNNSQNKEQQYLRDNYLPYLKNLQSKYSKYLKDAIIENIMGNKTNIKIYLHTKYYVLESLHSREEKNDKNSCILKAIQKKKQNQNSQIMLQTIGLPAGFSHERLITKESSSKDFQTVKAIQKKIKQKYQYLFMRNYAGFIAQKKTQELNPQVSIIQVVFKSSFGYFKIEAQVSADCSKPISYGSIKSLSSEQVKQIETNQTDKCIGETQLFDLTQKVCYQRIANCQKQISDICIICDKDSIINLKRDQCLSKCSYID